KDEHNATVERNFTVTLTDVYEAPPNSTPTNLNSIALLTIAENQPIGTVVGEFNATDPDAGATLTYHLVSGTGDTHNSLFTLETNGTLKTATTFDYETNASTYSIRVQAKDEFNATVEGNFTVVLTDIAYEPSQPNHTVDLNASVNLEMIWVEPGTFTMGSPTSEANRATDETEHNVTLTKGFYLGKYEVTQAQYEAVMAGNSNSLSATPSQYSGNPNRPVEKVSWDDAQVFLTRLNAAEQTAGRLPAGWSYVLPTESQWEYACRAGTTTVYSWGNAITSANANYYISGINLTTVVGQYAANPWGFFDMNGNVREWTADWYGTYPAGPVTDPPGAASGSRRVRRGGSWDDPGAYLRSALRVISTPGNRNSTLGFRVGFQQTNTNPANLNSTAPLTIAENQPIGSIVGQFQATDVDAGSTLSFSFASGAGDAHNSLFNLGSTTSSMALLWQQNFAGGTNGFEKMSPVIDSNGDIFVGLNEHNEIRKLSAADGSTLQTYDLKDALLGTGNNKSWKVAVSSDTLYAANGDTKQLIAFDKATGARKAGWPQTLGTAAYAIPESPPFVHSNGNVYVTSNGPGFSFNNSGKIFGFTPNGTQLFTPLDVDGQFEGGFAEAADGTLIATGKGGTFNHRSLIAFNPATGAELWHKTAGTSSGSNPNGIGSSVIGPPAILGTSVVINGDDNNTRAFDVATGNELWSFSHPNGSDMQAGPAVGLVGGTATVFVGSSNGITAIQPDGSANPPQLWNNLSVHAQYSTPVFDAARNMLYVGDSSNGEIVALDATTGSRVWVYATGHPVMASPALDSSGNLYVGNNNGDLFAFSWRHSANLTNAFVFDYETNASTYTIRVQAKDEFNATVEGNFTVTLTDVSYEPSQPPHAVQSAANLEMLWVEPGSFTMGSPTTEAGREASKEQEHNVTLTKGFYLGKYEVTQAQYEAVMTGNTNSL
ncbi:MAG: SUMF1/EgtB/PvdO family nonheme iron enzyme, partial [Opitutae bacterium]|nr:SUMF1/EgtB/PvdO family nonheme iron enzyme [Opitutae bacterium]